MASRRLNAVSAQEALVESMRERIFAGEFPRGAPLSDVELANEYGVARPTVRAAVQALVHEGLMKREPRRRAFVPLLTADDIRDLYYVRLPLELTVVEALVERRSVPATATAAVEELEALGSGGSWREAVEADIRFHAALVAGAGSPRLERVYTSLQLEIRLALVQLQPAYETLEVLAAEHRGLLGTIVSGPKRSALKAMREHLERAVEDLTSEQ